MICTRCKATVNVAFMCDQAPMDEMLCGPCFETTPCGQGRHEEGCETMVCEGAENETQAVNP